MTREEYNEELENANMIDINVKKEDFIKNDVKFFAKNTSVFHFNAII